MCDRRGVGSTPRLIGIAYTLGGRFCGAPLEENQWEGWLEFVPLEGGTTLRSPRETTQPNRVDTEYWATGLTHIYLEGALQRALDAANKPPQPQPVLPQPAFKTSASPPGRTSSSGTSTSVLNPFSVYQKGEPLLRRQLSALSAWHLVNIALEYELTDEDAASLNRRPAAALVDLIVTAVRNSASQMNPA